MENIIEWEKHRIDLNAFKQDVIIFKTEPVTDNKHEIDLYKYMKEASGDNIL